LRSLLGEDDESKIESMDDDKILYGRSATRDISKAVEVTEFVIGGG
jgi:hypothetical protein